MPASYTVFVCDYCGFQVRSANDQSINVVPESWVIFSSHDMPGGQSMVCGWECIARYAMQRAQGGPAELPFNKEPCRCGQDHPFDNRPRSRTLPPPEFLSEPTEHGHSHPAPPERLVPPAAEDEFPWLEGESRIPFHPEEGRRLRAERGEYSGRRSSPCTDCEKKRNASHH